MSIGSQFKFSLVFMAFSLIGLPSARAARSCQTLFADAKAAESSPPVEFAYLSQAGANRYFRDGLIWQMQSNQWVPIGRGSYDGRTVLESDLNQPNLTPLSGFQISSNVTQANRYYPNTGEQYPSMVRTVQIGSHVIEIQAPANLGLETHINNVYSVLMQLPFKRIESLKVIRINTRTNKNDNYWQAKYKDFTHSAATGGNGEIDLYECSLNDFRDAKVSAAAGAAATRLLRHEFGHLIASRIFGSVDPTEAYAGAARQDLFAVSEYGKNSWAEDFAEGIEAYLRTNAGSLDPRLKDSLRNRFAFFDDVFADRMPQSEHLSIVVKIVDARYIIAYASEIGIGIIIDLDEPAS